MIKRVNFHIAKFYLLSFMAGVVASLALPPIGIWFGIFALSLPMMGAINLANSGGTLKSAALLGWVTGAGWFLYSLSWISNALVTTGGVLMLLIPFSLIGLPIFLGLFWAVAFAIAHRIAVWRCFQPAQHVMMLIIMISVAEYVRGFILTGFPWNAPGLVLAANDIGLATASVTGYWGAGLLVLLLAAMPAMAFTAGRMGLLLCVAILLTAVGLGQMPTKEYQNKATGMPMRVIQPNIEQQDKWIPEKMRQHLADMIALSRAKSDQVPDLIIWPETAFADIYEHKRGVASAVAQAATQGQGSIITGVLSVDEDPFRIYNAAMIFGPDGKMGGKISKRHLVPFGEFVPLRPIVPFIDVIVGPVDFSPGSGAQSLTLKNDQGQMVSALTLICYEVIFPASVRASVIKENVDIIVALTNDAWFGNTIGPRQHLAMAQMRSAELGVPMIRSANTGVSAIIDSQGHILGIVDYGQSGKLDEVIGPSRQTIYREYGDVIYLLMLLIFISVTLCLRLTKI